MSKLAELQLGDARKKSFTWTRKLKGGGSRDITVLISIITQDELDESIAAATTRVEKLLEGKPFASTTRDELIEQSRVVEVLSRALRDPEHEDELWAEPETLRSKLSDVEVGLLYKAYCDWQDEQGPLLKTIDEAKFQALMREMSEEASLVPLALLAPDLRTTFVLIMARRLVDFLTVKSSPSSRSDANTSDNEKRPQSAPPDESD